MAALRQMTTSTCRVVRDGSVRMMPSTDLVPGDVVEIASGDVVPGDLRLIEVRGLRVKEAALTGESEPAAKTSGALPNIGAQYLAERHNMAFKGTAVTYGRARGVVVATGMQSEVGRIARLLQSRARPSTPLERRLARLGRYLAIAALIVVAVVFGAGIARGEPADEMFLTAVSLAVAAIPEGLPAACGRNAWFGDRDLLRQDRHPYAEPHGGRTRVDAARMVRREWLGIRARRDHPRRRAGFRQLHCATRDGGSRVQRCDARGA
jgi:Ca2+-transporting ATPase